MKKQVAFLLAKNKLKVTTARLAILSYLNQSKKPTDVADILAELKQKGIKADEATVYRILKAFVESNILNRIELQEGKWRYELASLPHHHHIICTNCRAIEDIPNCKMKSIENLLHNNTKFKVKDHRLEFYGLCPDCR